MTGVFALAPLPVLFRLSPLARLTAAAIDFATSGDNTIVAGVAGQTIRVYRVFFTVGAATNVRFGDTSPALFTGAMPTAANGGIVLELTGEPWFVTAIGAGLVVNSSNAVQVGGRVYYVQSV